MKKAAQILYIAVFLALLLVPLFLTERGKNVVSEIDNRTLAEFPEKGAEEFNKEFETYLQDRIGLRREMVNGYAVLNDRVAGELTHPIYTYGQDGYIFFKMHKNISYGEYHKKFAEMVLKLQQYCEERGSRFYFLFEPEKSSVLRRYLPKGVAYDDSWVDQMLAYMEELGVHCISNKDYLAEVSEQEMVFNRQYDAGHWNDLGCFYGTNNLLAAVHRDIPEVTELTKEEFDISVKTETKLNISEFAIRDEVPVFRLKSKYSDITADYLDELEISKRYPHFHYYRNEADSADRLPKLLFFQGSYYNSRTQFPVSRTSEYIGVHNYENIMNLVYYYNLFQPDVVVLDSAEYTFTDTYFNSSQMASLQLPPALFEADPAAGAAENLDAFRAGAFLLPAEEVQIFEGTGIDRIEISGTAWTDGNAYLAVNGSVYDLTRKDGQFVVFLPHGTLEDAQEACVCLTDEAGREYYFDTQTKIKQLLKELESGPVCSEGTKKDGSGFRMTTERKENRFGSVVLQIRNAETGELLPEIVRAASPGSYSSRYYHKEKSGEYIVRLRANSNLQDEYLEYTVYLEQGRMYSCGFEVRSLTETEALVSELKIYE